MAKRKRIRRPRYRAVDYQPVRARFWLDTDENRPNVKKRKTTAKPKHKDQAHLEGMHEARMSAYHSGKGHITRMAKNGTPHPFEVCSDRNIQAQEKTLEKLEKRARQFWLRRGEVIL